jgi:hypothetical protein
MGRKILNLGENYIEKPIYCEILGKIIRDPGLAQKWAP